ncbi:hypothetical protein [Delftia tsuruhatensis]|uniref:hypothetical protein n=1 Tax=Delftia tsuruhatensis TaxID=180282 RepID=UPI0020905EF6|nr:hypothetical protein [Delftia tsuruhatensis]MCO5339272.1 hypothetical protein [Delftia tsuruhatensis]MCR4546887.1 hypothetical protein [Delftia tsuruhatensis]
MKIIYIEDRLRGESMAEAMREQTDLHEGVVIVCMAPPLPVLIEQHHAELVQVLAQLEHQPRDEGLLEQQRELSSTIDALQRAADRVSGVALDQPADGRTIAMRRAFDIRFGRDSRDAKAPPMEYLALWAAAWHAAELETMAYIGGAMVCNIDLEPALEAPAAPDLRKTRDKAGILHYLTPEQMAEEIVRLDARLAAAPQAPAAPVGMPAQGDPAALLQLAEVLESGRSLINIERKEAAEALRRQAAAAQAAPAAPAVDAMSQAARDVLAERARQVEAEGWTPEHDDEHDKGELAVAAALYALRGRAGPALWITSYKGNIGHLEAIEKWIKPCDQRRSLEKAGALILADMERLDRVAASSATKGA